MTIRLEVSLLGGFQIRDGDGPVPGFDPPRLQALIAWLVLHAGVPQPRQQIAFLFWPESTERQARTNLRQLLHLLRRRLPNSRDVIKDGERALTWRADAAYSFDVHQFEQSARDAQTLDAMMHAIDSYRGDLLPQLYDDWLGPERERLRAMFTQLLERAISQADAEQEAEKEQAAIQRLIAHDPLHEGAYRALMRLSARRGDRAGVLRAYRACVAAWDRELGIQPSAETTALYEQLHSAQRDAVPPRVEQPRAGGRSALPMPATPLVDRVNDLAQIGALLRHSESRLVVVTGTGGIGKTRLALQLAVNLTPDLADEVWFVDLSAVYAGSGVVPELAVTLGLRAPDEAVALDALCRFFRPRRALLVLDNFEHVLDAAPAVAVLVTTASELRVLVTSRAPLQVRGEHIYALLPLAVPERGAPLATVATVASYDAVQLFAARARAVTPSFTVNDTSAGLVAEICRQVDGLPLAIELAAARLRAFPLATILGRLQHSLSILADGTSDQPDRQQTLHATIDWSYQLLEPVEQRLFTRLAIFVGGATLDAIAMVCPDADERAMAPEAVSNVLDVLVRQSLLQPDRLAVAGGTGGPRFRMLETLRAYALERLRATNEADALARRHATYFLSLAEQNQVTIWGSPQQAERLRRLSREHDNIRAALRWAIVGSDPGLALRLAGALGAFWFVRGFPAEGRAWLSQSLDAAPNAPTADRARALNHLGGLAIQQGDHAAAATALGEALALYRECADQFGIAFTLFRLGQAVRYQGDLQRAIAAFVECQTIAASLGEAGDVLRGLPQVHLGLLRITNGDVRAGREHLEQALTLGRAIGDAVAQGSALAGLGWTAHEAGDDEQALTLFAQCLAVFRDHGHLHGEADAMLGLGWIHLHRGDHDQALEVFRECVVLASADGRLVHLADALAGMAAAVGLRNGGAPGQHAIDAAALFGAAAQLHAAAGPPYYLSGASQKWFQEQLRAKMDADAWEAAWSAGRARSLDAVVALALELAGAR